MIAKSMDGFLNGVFLFCYGFGLWVLHAVIAHIIPRVITASIHTCTECFTISVPSLSISTVFSMLDLYKTYF